MINVVLYEPEIPQNTGNIMRTCMAFNCRLHLIEPLGFYMDEKHLKRAGMDYRDKIDLKIYKNYTNFVEQNPGVYYYVTRYGTKTPSDFDYTEVPLDKDIYLIFGKESTGIPKDILYNHLDHCMRIPMVAEARSLNLSNCVAICLYEVLSQFNFFDLAKHECIKGEGYLKDQGYLAEFPELGRGSKDD